MSMWWKMSCVDTHPLRARNEADDWSLVRVIDINGASVTGELAAISGNTFRGTVTIIVVAGLGGRIINNDISDCTICTSASVQILNSLVYGRSVSDTLRSAPITAATTSVFGCGTQICVGCSTGGREVLLSPRITYHEYTNWAVNRQDKATISTLTAAVASHRWQFESLEVMDRRIATFCVPWPCCVVRDAAIIANCAEIVESFICGHATLIGSTVKQSWIYGSERAPTVVSGHSVVERGIVHQGCMVQTGALITDSVLFPGSGARHHAVISQGIVASGTTVSEAEVSFALVGPSVGLHHHSLLIAALWPEGKGNVAYGANVGSNHTGKLPDQELLPGEGVFFGLGTSIKYPSNFDDAPYTLIASGVMTLPQAIALPFSLINQQGSVLPGLPGMTPAINEIFPGWMLSDNMYAIFRNELKFRERSRSLSSALSSPGDIAPVMVDWRILSREDIAKLVLAALHLLRGAKRPTVTLKGLKVAPEGDIPKDAFYNEVAIRGMGKNYMTERSRLQGIQAYERYLRAFALHHIFISVSGIDPWQEVSSSTAGITSFAVDMAKKFASIPDNHFLPHGSGYSLATTSAKAWTPHLVAYAQLMEEDIKAAAESKSRDSERGKRILSDYDVVHPRIDEDTTIKELRSIHKIIHDIVKSLNAEKPTL